MKVRAVISFASMIKGEMQPWPVGRVAELPEGVNWLELGWIVEVEAEAEESDEPTETSKPKRRTKKVADGG